MSRKRGDCSVSRSEVRLKCAVCGSTLRIGYTGILFVPRDHDWKPRALFESRPIAPDPQDFKTEDAYLAALGQFEMDFITEPSAPSSADALPQFTKGRLIRAWLRHRIERFTALMLRLAGRRNGVS